MPGLSAYKDITGCAFAPRCPNAVPDCTRGAPPFVEVAPGHTAACIRTAATGAIAARPLATEEGTAAGAPVLAVSALCKDFLVGGMFNRSTFAAVREVSFALGANEFLGVVGESGSGKTTLARLLVDSSSPRAELSGSPTRRSCTISRLAAVPTTRN